VDKRFLTAFLNPSKYVVGGIELDFFCPRHYITLQAVGSPFLNPQGAEGLTYKDLFIALRICSTKNWEEAVKKPPLTERWKYYLLEGLVQKQALAYAQFGYYLNESMTVPKVWMKEDESSHQRKPSNLPETVALATILMTKFGFREDEAWNMPFAKAVWYATAFGIQEGGEVSIITTETEENEAEDLSKLGNFEESMKKILEANKRGKDIKVL
jgi:hypothetical protein